MLENVLLYGYTTTYNVEYLIPYVMPYVERLGYDKFIVYDNGSTDKTIELLKQYPFVEIRHFDTNGAFSDKRICDLHAEAVIECGALDDGSREVWMTWTDFDEVFYLSEFYPFKEYLHNMKKYWGYNYYSDKMVELFFNNFRTHSVKEHELVHTLPDIMCHYWEREGVKPSVICVSDMQFLTVYPGNHWMEVIPKKDVSLNNLKNTFQLFSFHLKYIDFETFEKKMEERAQRLEKENKDILEHEWLFNPNCFKECLSACFPITTYFALRNLEDKGNGTHKEGLILTYSHD